MKIGRIITKNFKRIALAPLVLLRYGTLWPKKVRLVGCKHWVHIDPSDGRAVKKLIHDPLRGRISPPSNFWRAFNQHLQPTVAVDVGVNYGECLFSTRYASSTQVFGFEANPRLADLLEKSRMAHPDGRQITITHGLVSDSPGEDIPFFVNPSWSGGASAIASINAHHDILTYKISARSLDSVIPQQLVSGGCLLFKMDIEGYESRAFCGFEQTLEAAALAVGFIEFDTGYITAAGESPEVYFLRLAKRFDIYRLQGSQTLLRVADFSTLPRSRVADGRVHTDLVLVTHGASASQWLPIGWTIKSAS
jgi:FkbM family methyltransferase